MRIAVLIKQVPDSTDLSMDKETGTLIREGAGVQINPFDLHALEEGIRICQNFEEHEVVAICMGPPRASDSLLECLQYGADKGVLLSDRAFAGSDTLATSRVLSSALKKLGPWDMVLCGKQAIDGDTAQVGPGVAGLLDIPHITEIDSIEVDCEKLDYLEAKVKRFTQTGWAVLKVKLPALFAVSKDINIPRLPSIEKIRTASTDDITTMNIADIDADPSTIGLNGSPTWVSKIAVPETNRSTRTVSGTSWECAKAICEFIREGE